MNQHQQPPQGYYLSFNHNGTEDEITIHAPEGNCLAFIWFWDAKEGEVGAEYATAAKASAQLIIDALNAFDPTGEKSRDCHATLPGFIAIE